MVIKKIYQAKVNNLS